jgi:hypothetical protein
MELLSSLAGALAAAILSIPAVSPSTQASPKSDTNNAADISVSKIEQTIGVTEIKSAEYIPPAPAPVRLSAPSSGTIVGTKSDWLAGSGIDQSDWGYVDYIIERESKWDPNATNRFSGAHGLPQALPYSKTGCGWVDAVCQLRWANGYAVGRYGSWAGAYNYWLSHKYW